MSSPNHPAPVVSGDSHQFAEGFSSLNEHQRAAREASGLLEIEPVTPLGADLLTFLARTLAAKAVVEIGTGAGVSGLALLAGITADGVLTSIDSEADHQQQARSILNDAGYPTRRARLIAGSALNVLPKLSDAAYDLVFVDGDPLETVEYVAQAARLLRPGGVLVVNHGFAGGAIADDDHEGDDAVIMREVLEAVKQMDEFAPLLLPIGDGLLVASRA